MAAGVSVGRAVILSWQVAEKRGEVGEVPRRGVGRFALTCYQQRTYDARPPGKLALPSRRRIPIIGRFHRACSLLSNPLGAAVARRPGGYSFVFRPDACVPGKDALTLTRRRPTYHRSRCTASRAGIGRLLAWWLAWVLVAWGSRSARSEIRLPPARQSAAIQVRADHANRWQEGQYEVWVLQGDCRIVQDTLTARSARSVLWVHRPDRGAEATSRVIAYLEGDVQVQWTGDGSPAGGPGSFRDQQWLGRFSTWGAIEVDAPQTDFQPPVRPALYERGLNAWHPAAREPIRPVASAADSPPPAVSPADSSGGTAAPSPAAVSPPAAASRAPVGTGVWPPPTFEAQPPSAAPVSPVGPSGLPPAASSVAPGPLPAREALPPATARPRPTARQILIRSRSNVRMQGRVFPSPDGTETIALVTSGVNVIVSGIEGVPGLASDTIDLEADRIVIWTAAVEDLDLSGETSGERIQPQDAPLEFYLEGNIVFREGDRVIYADRMYYNVQQRTGMVLNAEVLTPAPEYEGLVRLKAHVLQQVDASNFRAFGAAVTSSRLGVPRYWFQAETVDFQDHQRPRIDPFTGQLVRDPETGEAAVEHDYLVTSRNNFVFLGGVPVLFWPVMATDLANPAYYVNSLQLSNDRVFGLQVDAEFDVYQVLGLRNPPPGTRWSFSPAYYSERGPALGTEFRYNRHEFLNFAGPVTGRFDAWGIRDRGEDNLGRDRRSVVPDRQERGRILWQHRQALPSGLQFTGEVGWISDRNFLEQYFEEEWDEAKDLTTGIELKQYLGSSTWSLSSDVRLNDFMTQTEWLPRGDHFVLGASFWDLFTWSAHTHAGYARLRTAELPDPGVETLQASIPWETDLGAFRYDDREGLRAATRHELGLPMSLGPARVVPYALGELAYWNDDRDGEEVERAYGQVGIRGSLPFWSVNPAVQSTLWNVNGIAHKVTLDADFFLAESSEPFTRLPLYDPLDDDSTEHFRRRLIEDLYGGVVPIRFDERYYALRRGLQGQVTSPSAEVADDLMLLRGGLRQRWQTKRGQPGQERIIDWIVLDIEGTWFPKPERDNFGQDVGLLNYDFRWHVGDRLTLLSDGFADVFEDGLRTTSFGGMIQRPLRGSLYLGYRTIGGPIRSNRVSAQVNYWMSDKWILNAGALYDFSNAGGLREYLNFTRIGESLLVRLGLQVDHTRNDFSVMLAVEPRFLQGRLAQVGGQPIPPLGSMGIE